MPWFAFAHNFGSISRKANTMTHVLTFFIAMISACSYYAMWEGMGVIYKVRVACALSSVLPKLFIT